MPQSPQAHARRYVSGGNMVKTLGGKLVKALSVILAAVVLAGCLAFAGCTGSHPEIEMRITFNGEEYVLTYRLYRNYYRQTVDHYMELIEEGYFDGTVIHDYQKDRMVSGGYTYEDMENGDAVDDLKALDYDAATTDADGNVTLNSITVWADVDRTLPTNRLHGEISGNGFSVEDGGLSNRKGALGAYTYVSSTEKRQVTYSYSSTDGYGQSEYYKNSFTGLFYIYKSTSSSPAGNYCVFGELADDASEDAFDELLNAIEAYTEENDNTFTETKEDVRIYDEFVDGGSYNVDFSVPVAKIVIEEIRVTKY